MATQSCWQNALGIIGLAFKKEHALDYALDSQIWEHAVFDMPKFLAKKKSIPGVGTKENLVGTRNRKNVLEIYKTFSV